MSDYTDIRDAILAHAAASALAVDPTWTNVEVGWPYLSGSKGVRLCYGGEDEAPRFTHQRALNGDEFVGDHLTLVAWWAVSNLAIGLGKAIDTEMHAFKHELRSRVTADPDLGGDAVGVVMDYVEPDTVVVSGTRFALLGADFLVGPIEYPYTPSP